MISLLLKRENRGVASKLLFYSILMFTVPFLAFFFLRDYALGGPDVDFATRNNWSVGGAVVAVNLVIAAYVYDAFSEPETEEEVRERDKRMGKKERTD